MVNKDIQLSTAPASNQGIWCHWLSRFW